jgi:hypothetical protein
MRRTFAIACATALALVGFADGASAQACGTIVGVNDGTPANDNIAADTTWGGAANPSPICLESPIFVQDGVTLTILPGTVVRGQPRRAVAGAVAGTPGALIVTQGAKLVADGTVNAPIVMTTGAVDNDGDGVCDDGNGNSFFDPHPGFRDVPAGCIAAGTCATPEIAANATFCDADPTGAPMPPLASDGTANLSQWGGLVLLGRGPTNLADELATPGGHGFGFVEGLTLPGFEPTDAQCGGVEPHDTSGVVRYVSVRHAGDEIGNGNELNGVTLCAVGDNTIFEFVEVYANFDDGFEWFGGTMNSNHLVVTYAGDDQLDIDWGFTGTIQYALTMTPFFDEDSGAPFGSASGDKMAELDGDDYNRDAPAPDFDVNVRTAYSNAVFPLDPLALATDSRDTTPWPLSSAYISNWTGIGSTTDGANPATNAAAAVTGVQFRHGFAGQVQNSAFVNVSNACLAIDTGTGEAADPHDVVDHIPAGLARWVANSCDGSAALAAGAANATGAANQGDAFALFDTGLACSANIRSTGGGFAGLVQEDPGFNGKVFGGTPYDPRPAGAGADCGVTPRVPGMDRAATFRGAFPAGVPLWTDGWTVLSQAGVL